MTSKASLLVVSLSVILLFRFVLRLLARRRKARSYAQAHGCQQPFSPISGWQVSIWAMTMALKATRSRHLMVDFKQVFDAYGSTFKLNVFGSHGIDTIEPENIECILSTKFQDYGMGVRKAGFAPLLGKGIFAQDGSHWKHARDLYRPLFTKSQSDGAYDIVKHHADNLVAAISKHSTSGTVDLYPLFFSFTLDTTYDMIFRKAKNSFLEDKPSSNRFATAFRDAQQHLTRRYEVVGLYWLIDGLKFRRDVRTVHAWVDEQIADYLDDRPNEKDSNGGAFHPLMEVISKETKDRRAMRDHVLNFMLAGRDTTACTLSWTFRLLVRHPTILGRLRKEIQSVVGLGSSSDPTGREPTREDLKQMPYLGLVLKEVLRLYPPVPINARAARVDTVLPTGGGPTSDTPIFIPAGNYVEYSVYCLHRRLDLYGPTASSFDPERWTKPPSHTFCLDKIGWAYIPFNGGPRTCLGQEFAQTEVKFAIVRILQMLLRIEFPEEGKKPQEREVGEEEQSNTLVLAPYHGCEVSFR